MLFKDYVKHGNLEYDINLLKDELGKPFHDKMIVTQNATRYFVDDEGIFWDKFMKGWYPNDVTWECNHKMPASTVAQVVGYYLDGILFCLNANKIPFVTNVDNVIEISGDSLETDGVYKGHIIGEGNVITSGEFKTFYGMPIIEGGKFGRKLETEERHKLKVGYTVPVVEAVLSKEHGMYVFENVKIATMPGVIQLFIDDKPALIVSVMAKNIEHLDTDGKNRDIVNTILNYYDMELVRVKAGKVSK